jgi:hypothetical protein
MHIAHSAILISCCMASSALTALAVQSGTQPETSELVRCKRVEIVDSAGRTRIVLGDFSELGKDQPDFEPELIYGLAIQAPGQDEPAIALIGARDYASIGAYTSMGYSANLSVGDDCAIFELSDGSGKEAVTRVTDTSCELEMHDGVRGGLTLGGPYRPLGEDEEQRFFGLNVADRLGNESHFDARGAHGKTLRMR